MPHPVADKDKVIDELIKEVRSLRKQLEAVKAELYKCKDLDRLSVPGAVGYLVRSEKVLVELKELVASAAQARTQPERLLDKISNILVKIV